MRTERTITIRETNTGDAESLKRLAELDSTSLSDGPYLLAERDGVPLAAIELGAGSVIADPFQPTADLVGLLQETVGSEQTTRSPQLLGSGGFAAGTA